MVSPEFFNQSLHLLLNSLLPPEGDTRSQRKRCHDFEQAFHTSFKIGFEQRPNEKELTYIGKVDTTHADTALKRLLILFYPFPLSTSTMYINIGELFWFVSTDGRFFISVFADNSLFHRKLHFAIYSFPDIEISDDDAMLIGDALFQTTEDSYIL